jgi:hypothetical protein
MSVSLTLNTTLTDPYANSYADVAYCDGYWNQHYSTVKATQWSALSTDQKTSLLIIACRVIETARFTAPAVLREQFGLDYSRRTRTVITMMDRLTPAKYLYTQRLQFPRNLDVDVTDGHLFVPEPILMAQCEQTVYTLNFDDTAIANRMQGISADATYVGNIHLRQSYLQDGSQFAPSALEMCRPFLMRSSSRLGRS